MNTTFFTPPTKEFDDPIIREEQREFLTAVSRSHVFQLERLGLFPKHIQLSPNAIGWKLKEVLAWVRTRPVVELKELEVCNGTN